MIRQGLLGLVIAGTLCWAGSASAQVCEAAKNKAAGTLVKCMEYGLAKATR